MSNVEEHIRRAMEEGRFDDLPGKGKPLRLDEDTYEDPEWRLAQHILRNSGYSLPWIEARREIEADLEEARAALRRAWAWHQRALAENAPPAFVTAQWKAAADKFQEQLILINKRIFNYNLEAPHERFQLRQLSFERELDLTNSPASDTLPD